MCRGNIFSTSLTVFSRLSFVRKWENSHSTARHLPFHGLRIKCTRRYDFFCFSYCMLSRLFHMKETEHPQHGEAPTFPRFSYQVYGKALLFCFSYCSERNFLSWRTFFLRKNVLHVSLMNMQKFKTSFLMSLPPQLMLFKYRNAYKELKANTLYFLC